MQCKATTGLLSCPMQVGRLDSKRGAEFWNPVDSQKLTRDPSKSESGPTIIIVSINWLRLGYIGIFYRLHINYSSIIVKP